MFNPLIAIRTGGVYAQDLVPGVLGEDQCMSSICHLPHPEVKSRQMTLRPQVRIQAHSLASVR